MPEEAAESLLARGRGGDARLGLARARPRSVTAPAGSVGHLGRGASWAAGGLWKNPVAGRRGP
jgi:hypothetical protein